MSDGFRTTPDEIRSQASVFQDAAADLSTSLQILQSSLTCLGNVTGDDDPGRKIAERYDHNASVAEANAQALAKGATTIAHNLRTMAGNYTGQDAANCDLLSPMP
jgi:uncharacterized protein YukE